MALTSGPKIQTMAKRDLFTHGTLLRDLIPPRIRLLAVFAAFGVCGWEGGGEAQKAEGFQTAAPHAILIEAESGSVLFEKSADQLIYPASLTKLMTAEVVFHEIKEGRLDLETEFVISENAWRR